ncbi:MAG: DivIVA domain-containing protein [Acidimicrobiia bacterium]|nr:DivIVA domain-containing protein [Acidimicrobiia bacterium]MDH3470200.1 DivIVA domain-containing protein [Acidimicrobiia bacterium]
MKVKAETVRRHAFQVRRKGYEPAEVDAVMARIGQTLAGHEKDIIRLENELAKARTASEAMEDTFIALQQAKRQLLGEAQEEASRMKSEAEKGLRTAETEAERILQDAQQRVEQLFVDLRAKAESAIAKAQERVADAEGRGESIKAEAAAEAARLVEASQSEAKERIASAKKQSDEIVADANAQGQQIVEAARAEHDSLVSKVPQLRSAVADIERRIREFSSIATEDLEVVDAMINIADSEVSGGVASLVESAQEAGGESKDVAVSDTWAGDKSPADVSGAEASLIQAPDGEAGEESAAIADSNREADNEASADQVDEVVPMATVAAPDGSGTLPAAREAITNGELPSGAALAEEDADPARAAVAATEPPAPPVRGRLHNATRDDHDETTIYQRRGGGLRARLDAGEKRRRK